MNKEDITVIIDSREQAKHYYSKRFNDLGYKTKIEVVDVGDYTYEMDGENQNYRFALEKKSGNTTQGGGHSELSGNWFNQEKSHIKKKISEKAADIRTYHLILTNTDSEGWRNIPRYSYKQGDNFQYEYKLGLVSFLSVVNNRRLIAGHNLIQIIYVEQEKFFEKVIELIHLDIKDKETSRF